MSVIGGAVTPADVANLEQVVSWPSSEFLKGS